MSTSHDLKVININTKKALTIRLPEWNNLMAMIRAYGPDQGKHFTEFSSIPERKGGWYWETTGGGCTALQYKLNDGTYLMVTDEAEIPVKMTTDVLIGRYEPESGDALAMWAPVVQPGVGKGVDETQSMQENPRFHTQAPEVVALVRKAFPEYTGRHIELATWDHPLDMRSYWDSGSRDYWKLIDLVSGQQVEIPTQHPYFDKPVAGADAVAPRPGVAAVQLHFGMYKHAVVHMPAENLTKLLPETEQLTLEEKRVLYSIRSLKSGYGGIKNFRWQEYRRRMGGTLDLAGYEAMKAALAQRGLLTRSGAITDKGRNSISDVRNDWSLREAKENPMRSNPGTCPVCGGPGWGMGEICMECVKARHRGVLNRKCTCGKKAIPSAVKQAGSRRWISCERCLAPIKQLPDAKRIPGKLAWESNPPDSCPECGKPTQHGAMCSRCLTEQGDVDYGGCSICGAPCDDASGLCPTHFQEEGEKALGIKRNPRGIAVPYLPPNATQGQKVEWVRKLFKAGLNFHPDTPAADYIDYKTRKRVFSAEDARVFEQRLEIFMANEKDPYKLAVEGMRLAGYAPNPRGGPNVMHYAALAPGGGYEAACGKPSRGNVTPDRRYVTCKVCQKWMAEGTSSANPASKADFIWHSWMDGDAFSFQPLTPKGRKFLRSHELLEHPGMMSERDMKKFAVRIWKWSVGDGVKVDVGETR